MVDHREVQKTEEGLALREAKRELGGAILQERPLEESGDHWVVMTSHGGTVARQGGSLPSWWLRCVLPVGPVNSDGRQCSRLHILVLRLRFQ